MEPLCNNNVRTALYDNGANGINLIRAYKALTTWITESISYNGKIKDRLTVSTSVYSNAPAEVEQGYIRLILLTLFACYILFLINDRQYDNLTLTIILIYSVVSYTISLAALFLLKRKPSIRKPSRWVLQTFDLLLTTAALFILGVDGHFMFFAYLFVSVGYGIRYSLAHLKFGLILSLTFYTIYILLSDTIPERGIIFGNYALLIILPPYIASLIKQLNQALNAAQASDRAKTMFLANISHELRTPLVGVLTAAELMETRNWSKDNLSLLKTIQNSSEILTNHINRILDYARIESGDSIHELKPLRIHKLLDDCISILSPQAAKKGINLIVDSEGLPSYITGDDASIRQILINIIGNAIKFTETGSVTVKLGVDNQQLSLTVVDTGIGIPANKIHSIFDPFTQADGTITKKFGGTGLGIAITKQLIENLGGDIQIDSVEGHGTTVNIFLPCSPGSDESCVEENKRIITPVKVDSNASILVADDNLTNQHIIRMILTKSGFSNIDLADNGQDALSSMLQKKYDLVILDRHMPEMGGGEALKKFKQSGKDVLSILLTADQTQETLEEYSTAGFTQLIIKPFSKDTLNEAVNSLLATS